MAQVKQAGQDMIQEVLISPLGWAVITCPECGLRSHTKPGRELLHKVIERTCICGAKYQLIFDTRSEPRRKCSLPGILLGDENITVEIISISEIGASFQADELNLDIGNFHNLKIKINDKWIEVLIKIIRVNQDVVGCEFVNLSYNERKMIESYLISN